MSSHFSSLFFNKIEHFRYIAWNVHEPYQGVYDFTGQNDVEKFLDVAAANDLLVILRPGPYICAEWEYGGFPYWVMKTCQKTIRTSDPVYMRLVNKWLSVLLQKIKPHLYENGGPVISVQVSLYKYGTCKPQLEFCFLNNSLEKNICFACRFLRGFLIKM